MEKLTITKTIPEEYRDLIFPSEISENGKKYIHEYPFLDKFFLAAIVDRESGNQKLEISVRNNVGAKIDYKVIHCIHTAVCEIPANEFIENMHDKSYYSKLMKIKSTEHLPRITLSPEEHFIAFKMWVSGIAEANLEAFKIQSEIESLAGFATPISHQLLTFIAQHDINIYYKFLWMVESSCRFEGKLHLPCLIANLLPIAKVIRNSYENRDKFLDALINIEFPIELYTYEDFWELLTYPAMVKHPNFSKLFFNFSPKVRYKVFDNPRAHEFKEFGSFYKDKYIRIRTTLAERISATYRMEYKYLIEDKEDLVRWTAAKNPNAPKFLEYQKLFTDPNPLVREAAASNTAATKYESYSVLFKDPVPGVRWAVFKNSGARRFTQYRLFFKDPEGIFRLTLAKDPAATEFEEFKELFKNLYGNNDQKYRKKSILNENEEEDNTYRLKIRRALAKNPSAIQFKGFTNLFYDDDVEIRKRIAQNESAANFKEYRMLFYDRYVVVRKKVALNPNATKYDDYRKLFEDKNKYVRLNIVKNPNSIKFEEYKDMFYSRFDKIRIELAKSHSACNFDEYRVLFTDLCPQVRWEVAKNPTATKFPEFVSLFNDNDFGVKKSLTENLKAREFKEFEKLIDDSDPYLKFLASFNP